MMFVVTSTGAGAIQNDFEYVYIYLYTLLIPFIYFCQDSCIPWTKTFDAETGVEISTSIVCIVISDKQVWFPSKVSTVVKLYQHRPQIALKGISGILQFVSSRFTRYIFFHRHISGQETNQNTDTKYNQTEIEIDLEIILRTPTRTRIRWHLHWHPPWQPSLRFANPWPLHDTSEDYTSNDTLCDDRSWICEPWPLHTPNDTANDTLCDSRTLTPTHPPTTPCVTAPPPPATNPQNLRTLTPQLEVRTPIAKAIWGKMSKTCLHHAWNMFNSNNSILYCRL